MNLFSPPTFEHCNQFIIVCFAHDELMVDWSERRREKHVLLRLLVEEAEAMPAESVRLQRKSTSTKYKKGNALSHIS